MLQLVNIHKNFGPVVALAGVNLTAAAGSIQGIVGENGAGKSTLMKILTGYLSRTSGDIFLGGQSLAMSSPRDARRAGIGMLYQEPLDFPQLSILDNFLAGAKPYRRKEGIARLAALNHQFGFELTPEQLVETLTIGERQQLEFLRLIDEGVNILILDEPTTGISDIQKNLLFLALNRLKQQNATILLVSHKLEEIDQLCDQVTVLNGGQVVEQQNQPFDRARILEKMFSGTIGGTTKPRERRSGKPILQFTDVSSSVGRSGLDGVSITIRQGEIVGLAGVDGSGQSTFLKICCGLLRPERGTAIRFDRNIDVVSYRDQYFNASQRTIFLPADRLNEGLFANLTIREHHLLAGNAHKLLKSSTGTTRTTSLIEQFSIKGNAATEAAALSGGNQQRLLLSLIPEQSRLILLEQPTRGLDVHSAAWTWEFLQQRTDIGATIVFASPELDEILSNASRVVVFFGGRIILDRPVSEVTQEIIAKAITGATVQEPHHV